ncbi:hypothetical protein OAO01_09420, partial [Oligoflexia bacterium]|nr:hypothetical protein [Oligoflexia bacterium]
MHSTQATRHITAAISLFASSLGAQEQEVSAQVDLPVIVEQLWSGQHESQQEAFNNVRTLPTLDQIELAELLVNKVGDQNQKGNLNAGEITNATRLSVEATFNTLRLMKDLPRASLENIEILAWDIIRATSTGPDGKQPETATRDFSVRRSSVFLLEDIIPPRGSRQDFPKEDYQLQLVDLRSLSRAAIGGLLQVHIADLYSKLSFSEPSLIENFRLFPAPGRSHRKLLAEPYRNPAQNKTASAADLLRELVRQSPLEEGQRLHPTRQHIFEDALDVIRSSILNGLKGPVYDFDPLEDSPFAAEVELGLKRSMGKLALCYIEVHEHIKLGDDSIRNTEQLEARAQGLALSYLTVSASDRLSSLYPEIEADAMKTLRSFNYEDNAIKSLYVRALAGAIRNPNGNPGELYQLASRAVKECTENLNEMELAQLAALQKSFKVLD